MKQIITILFFIATSLQASAQTGFFRPAYIGHLPDTHNIQVLVGDTTLKYGAWIGIDSLTTLVGSAGVSGLTVDEVTFGRVDGTLEQSPNLVFINNDSLVLDSSLTINGVSGLTPTTVKVLKDGVLEFDRNTAAAGVWMRLKPLQQTEDNPNFNFNIESATSAFSDRNNDVMSFGWNLLAGGTREKSDQHAMGFSLENNFTPNATDTVVELHYRIVGLDDLEKRVFSYVTPLNDLTGWYGYNSVNTFYYFDPDGGAQWLKGRRVDANQTTLDISAGLTKYTQHYLNGAGNYYAIIPSGMGSFPELYLNSFYHTYLSRAIVQTLPAETANTLIGRAASNYLVGVSYQEAADSIANHITFENPGGGIDSIVTCWNGDLGFIVMGDTTCVSEDSFYVIGPCTYFIIMNDTVAVCIPEGTPGLNIGNSNLSVTNTPGGLRTFNIDTVNFHIRRGTSNRFSVNTDGANSVITARGGSVGMLQTQMQLSGINLETHGAGLHFNGLTDGTHIRDYSFWLNPGGSGSFMLSETNQGSDPVWQYYGFLDSLTFHKPTQFDAKVLDEDGDTGSAGNILMAQSDGTVNWVDTTGLFGGGGAGGPIPINDLQDADGTNDIDNDDFTQTWRWNTLSANAGLDLRSTSTAATSNTQSILNVALSGANANSSQQTYGIFSSNTHTGTGSSNYAGFFTASGGTLNLALTGNSVGSNSIGVTANANDATSLGLWANNTAGYAVRATTTTGVGLSIDNNTAATNTVTQMIEMRRQTSGTPANGIGLSVGAWIENGLGTAEERGRLSFLLTDVTNGSEDADFEIYLEGGGAGLSRKMRMSSIGQLTLDTYGDGTHTVTATTRPVFDANGVMGEENGYAVLAVGHPAESKTNDVTTEQDYTSLINLDANYLTENRVIRVTLTYDFILGTSSATVLHYLEIGGVKVATIPAINQADGSQRSVTVTYTIQGTEAAGASAGVITGISGLITNINANNSTLQPVALATNGALTIVPGLQFSATGSTETFTLEGFLVEQLN